MYLPLHVRCGRRRSHPDGMELIIINDLIIIQRTPSTRGRIIHNRNHNQFRNKKKKKMLFALCPSWVWIACHTFLTKSMTTTLSRFLFLFLRHCRNAQALRKRKYKMSAFIFLFVYPPNTFRDWQMKWPRPNNR